MIAAIKIAAGIIVALVLLRLAVLALEPRLVFFPQRDLVLTPAGIGLPYEDAAVVTADGVRVRGWFVPAPASAAPAPVLLVFHGNAETIAHGLDLAARAHSAGFAVLLAEYRGYGGNPGSPSEEGIARDGLAFAAAAEERADGAPVVLWGRSIGASVAVRLAVAGHGAAVILESPFTSARDLLRDQGAWMFLALSYLGSYRFDAAAHMADVRVPVLVIHGTRDEIAPFAHGRRLFDRAPGTKALVALEGGGHNDLWARHADALWAGAERFVRALPAAAVPSRPGATAPPAGAVQDG
jgi:fermentation-respiration switch protein FrsA (DUF1100 family)